MKFTIKYSVIFTVSNRRGGGVEHERHHDLEVESQDATDAYQVYSRRSAATLQRSERAMFFFREHTSRAVADQVFGFDGE